MFLLLYLMIIGLGVLFMTQSSDSFLSGALSSLFFFTASFHSTAVQYYGEVHSYGGIRVLWLLLGAVVAISAFLNVMKDWR